MCDGRRGLGEKVTGSGERAREIEINTERNREKIIIERQRRADREQGENSKDISNV